MPGYNVDVVESLGESFYCSICKMLLRDAVQTYEEGSRCCESCYKAQYLSLVEESDSEFVLEDAKQQRYHEDKAMRKEILNLEVKCNHCEWQGKLKDHLSQCCLGSDDTAPAWDATVDSESRNGLPTANESGIAYLRSQLKLERELKRLQESVEEQRKENLRLQQEIYENRTKLKVVTDEVRRQGQAHVRLRNIVTVISENGEKCANAITTVSSAVKSFVTQTQAAFISMNYECPQFETHNTETTIELMHNLVYTGVQFGRLYLPKRKYPPPPQGMTCDIIEDDHFLFHDKQVYSIAFPPCSWKVNLIATPSRAIDAEQVLPGEDTTVKNWVFPLPTMSLLFCFIQPNLRAGGIMAIMRLWIPVRPGLQSFFEFVTLIPPVFAMSSPHPIFPNH